jgi:biotin carboxyl carrier protein
MPRTIRFEWEGKNYEVGVERAGDRLTLTHEGKRYVVTLLPERNESTASLSPAATQAPSAATARASTVQAPAGTPAPTATSMSTPTAAPTAQLDAAGALHAPMTGVIKEIRVGPGHNVELGQVILIMEAMKMDIDVPSPASGVVAEVLVKVGDSVNAQQKLIMIH